MVISVNAMLFVGRHFTTGTSSTKFLLKKFFFWKAVRRQDILSTGISSTQHFVENEPFYSSYLSHCQRRSSDGSPIWFCSSSDDRRVPGIIEWNSIFYVIKHFSKCFTVTQYDFSYFDYFTELLAAIISLNFSLTSHFHPHFLTLEALLQTLALILTFTLIFRALLHDSWLSLVLISPSYLQCCLCPRKHCQRKTVMHLILSTKYCVDEVPVDKVFVDE